MKFSLCNLQFSSSEHFTKSKKLDEPKRNKQAGFLAAAALKKGIDEAQNDSKHPLNRKTRVRKG